MNKTTLDDDDETEGTPIAIGTKNYITEAGYTLLKKELTDLLDIERPEVVKIVAWAASNGDRSENGDYIYGKKRLREIDKRIRFLTKRLDNIEIVYPSVHSGSDQIFFGATVRYMTETGEEYVITIVGVDEIDPLRGKISWVSPIARALNKAYAGDVVTLQTPHGAKEITVLEVCYPEP